MRPVKFGQFRPSIDPDLWIRLSHKKLHELRLRTDPIPSLGFTSTLAFTAILDSSLGATAISGAAPLSVLPSLPRRFRLTHESLSSCSEDVRLDPYTLCHSGRIVITNTLSEFRELDKSSFLRQIGIDILFSDFFNLESESNWIVSPEIHLGNFGVLVFADLKKYEFWWSMCFPTALLLSSTSDDECETTTTTARKVSGSETETEIEIECENVRRKYFEIVKGDLKGSRLSRIKGVFGVVVVVGNSDSQESEIRIISLRETLKMIAQRKILTDETEIQRERGTDIVTATRIVGFGVVDCGRRKGSMTMGWMTRNLITALALWFKGQRVKRMQQQPQPQSEPEPQDLDVEINLFIVRHEVIQVEKYVVKLPRVGNDVVIANGADDLSIDMTKLSFVGWNKKVRRANVGDLMDPERLAQESVNLNLQLMKWRMLPELDMEKLSATKALLIGSGTLGCHVARNLLAWGIFNIVMVDRGNVSHSNPVRQPLYEFADVGNDKASTAVEHLKRIYPKVNAVSHTIDIPMPGHPIIPGSEDTVRERVELMERLIEEADVVFLLTDTRESRWLPAMLAMVHDTLVINAALGFEAYVVMRHGLPPKEEETEGEAQETRLGCYFCNDVVEPVDSTKDRTLDQQCTVTRPGGSAIAGALAVELLVALLHHPEASRASPEAESPLGQIPHQIRGSLSNFQNLILRGSSYSQCIACSDHVLNAYKEDGFDFLLKAFNQSSILAELTGLRELQEKTTKMLEDAMQFESLEEDGFDIL